MEEVLCQHFQDAKSIHNTAPEIDGGGFREIARCDRHLLKGKFAHHALGNDLRIEEKDARAINIRNSAVML